MIKLRTYSRKVGLFALAAAAFGAGSLNASPASATVRIIAVAKFGDSQMLRRFVIKMGLALSPGDSLLVYEAPGQDQILGVAIPKGARYDRPDRKAEIIAPELARAKDWFDGMRAPAADDPNFINANSLLDTIAPVIAEYGGPARVLFIGPPWFSAQGAFSAKTYIGAYPSDGLILGSRSESPFGTEGRQDLNGVTVDYCVMGGAGIFSSPAQGEMIHRAWSLDLHQRGANLSTFTTDMSACLNSFARPTVVEGEHFAFDEADARLKRMERVEEAKPVVESWQPKPSSPPEITNPGPWGAPASATEQRTIFDHPVRTLPPTSLSGPAWLGVRWRETVDLDLYARCSPNSPFLYYGNRLSPEGRHDFDFKGGTGEDFEVVELLAPCGDISKAEVWVNFFNGSVRTPIKGDIAIKFGGGLYKIQFTMPALAGNGGHGFAPNGSMTGPNWVRIDVKSLLRIPTSAASRSN